MTYKQSRTAALRAIKREIKAKGIEQFNADRAALYERLRRDAAAQRINRDQKPESTQ